AHVLEEVLLSPTLEHTIRHLDVAQVPSARDHVCLVAAVAQARHLAQAKLAFEEAHGVIVQKIVHQSPVKLGATANEPPPVDAAAMPFAIGQHVEAALDHLGEQLWAPAAAVEDNGHSSLANSLADLAKQTGHSLRQGGIDLSGDHQQRVAGAVVDP